VTVNPLTVFAEHVYRGDGGTHLYWSIETGQFIVEQHAYNGIIMVGLRVNAHGAVLFDCGGDFYAECNGDFLSVRKLDCYVSHHDSTPKNDHQIRVYQAV
jgi:hypothetical protein